MVGFTRSIFNAAFKTNPYLDRAIMTGITRVSIASCEALESVFSDLNYLDKRRTESYWANSSSNSLVGKLIREGNKKIKQDFETLLQGGSYYV